MTAHDDSRNEPRRGTPATLGLVLGALLLLLPACQPSGSPGARLYRRDCASCHGIHGGGGVMHQADEGADLLDDSWDFGGDRASIGRVIQEDLVFEHPRWEYTSDEVRQLADYILLELRGETR